MKKIDTLGTHLLIEMFGCHAHVLNSLEAIKNILFAAATAAKATPIEAKFHRFQPEGTSGFVLLADSHISIHTWPEEGYAAIDFFTCGDAIPAAGVPVLETKLGATSFEIMEISRGHLENPNAIRVLKHRRHPVPTKVSKEDVDDPILKLDP